ncbi:MAG: hypothetical protein FJX56_11110, partial [Alphaproteobacteria bacterium]|nr:hypothetical protein [Alphaproteobacteria bacterium]
MRAQKRAAAADAERAPAPRRVTGSAAGILHHATAAQIVVRHTGPVLVVDADGAILAHNAEAAPLVGAISAIADLIEQARGGAPTAM